MKSTSRLRTMLQGAGPAMAAAPAFDVVRMGIGAALGLWLCGWMLPPGTDLATGLFMIAPLGASAVLLFAVPNSPLAQPWSAIMGNTMSALVAVAVVRFIGDPIVALALALGLAIMAMRLARALHPPGGAVALTIVLSPETVAHLGFWFALAPVAAGTTILVVLAVLYARVTGRHYPFRLAPEAESAAILHPETALGLRRAELTDLLASFRQSTNLGAADLARLIDAAEQLAASHHLGDLQCADIMSPDPLSVETTTRLGVVADLFVAERFTSLPVVDPDGTYSGIIFQSTLIRQASNDAQHRELRFLPRLAALLRPNRVALRAGDIMQTAVPTLPPDASLSALMHLLADPENDATPIVIDGHLRGIVTRTDLVRVLTHQIAIVA